VKLGNLPVPVVGISRAIRYQMGEVLERLQRPAEAAVVYREILEMQPEDRSTRVARARALLGAGALDECERELDRLDDRPEDRGERLLLRATLAFQRGESDVARACYERALERKPRAWAAHLHLGHLAMQRLDFPAADAHYERALALADNPDTRLGRAACLLERNRLPECLEHLAAAVEACGDRPAPPGTEAVAGEALCRLGRWSEARGAFERHLERFGSDAPVLVRLADCYRELRVPEAARLGYRKALEIDPALAEARRGLESLETVSPDGVRAS
jgi:tetratricopeptide (TPR) repeat protein